MVLDILRDTPLWVWCVAGLVLWRGHALTRPQITSGGRLFTLPAAFLVISFAAAVTTFTAGSPIIVAWVLGALTAAFIWASRPQPEDLLFNRQNRTYRVPGSWAPLVLIMVAFCTRYAIGIALARHSGLRDSALFGVPSAFIFGSISGAFLGRALNIVGAGNFIITEKIPGRRAPEDVL
jgi:Family of unknown function (DUF6622)